jgi:hypothetical protein
MGSWLCRGWLHKAGYLGVLNVYHEIQASNFDRHDRWPMPCTAEQNVCFIHASLEGSPRARLADVPRADLVGKAGDRS